jgi:hypothetical protein
MGWLWTGNPSPGSFLPRRRGHCTSVISLGPTAFPQRVSRSLAIITTPRSGIRARSTATPRAGDHRLGTSSWSPSPRERAQRPPGRQSHDRRRTSTLNEQGTVGRELRSDGRGRDRLRGCTAVRPTDASGRRMSHVALDVRRCATSIRQASSPSVASSFAPASDRRRWSRPWRCCNGCFATLSSTARRRRTRSRWYGSPRRLRHARRVR